MFDTVIVPHDGSSLAESALEPAAAIAAETGARLFVYRALLEEDPGLATSMADRFHRHGIDPEDIVLDLSTYPAEGVVAFAQKFENPLICMATHGNGGVGRLMGTTTEDVLRRFDGSVVTVGRNAATPLSFRNGKVMVCVDGSEHSEAAAADAAEWISQTGAAPWVVTVLDTPRAAGEPFTSGDVNESAQVHRVAEHLTAAGAPAEWEVLHGHHAAPAIVEFAQHLPASLIVMSTHGRSGIPRIAVGSVAMQVASLAPCPVMIRRPASLPDTTDEQSGVTRHRSTTGG